MHICAIKILWSRISFSISTCQMGHPNSEHNERHHLTSNHGFDMDPNNNE